MPRKNKDSRSTESVEDFLKTVYALEQNLASHEERVSTNAISESLRISAPSVTDMAQRLHETGLIDYQRYRGIRLTAGGSEIALKVLRRHRLIELFLLRELDYELPDVHEEAEALEHAVSDRFVAALAAKLGDPAIDPHGDPIPQADGSIASPALLALSELPLNQVARVSRFITHHNDLLQYALGKGFRLESRVRVIEREPFAGPLTLELDGLQVVIGRTLADGVLVELV